MLRLDVPLLTLAGGALLGADHRDPRAAWIVPSGMAVSLGTDGKPSFILFRQDGAYGKGGNLLVSLQPVVPDAGAQAAGRTARLVPFRSLSARMRVTGETGTQLFSWRAARVTASGQVVLGSSFSPREMDALSPALDATPSPILVDAVFTYAGIQPGLPLVATVKLAALADRLRAALPPGPVPAGAFVATGVSLLALDPSLYKSTPTDDRSTPPDPSAVLAEIVARLLPTLAVTTPGASPDAPDSLALSTAAMAPSVDVDLSSPRVEQRTGTATWSVGDFLAGLDAAGRARALPSLTNPDVLSLVAVQVMTSAPFDARFLTRIDVGLRFHDAAGKVQQPAAKLVDGTRTQTIPMVRNVLAPLALERRITAVVSPDGAPRVVSQAYAPTGPVVDVDADALGLRFVVATVDADVFATTGAIALAFRPAADPGTAPLVEVTLDATTPSSTLVVPGATPGQPLWAAIRALPPGGGTSGGVVVGDRPVDDRIDVAVADVVPPTPINVTIARAAAATTDRYPTITVTVQAPGNPETLLKVGASSRVFKMFATSPFAAPSFDYKVDWIDTTQGFDVISGAFHTASTTTLAVDPQTEPRG
jgi:hypothetical protein